MENNRNLMLVLLAGQSNMAGRGIIESEDTVEIPGLYMLDRENKWIRAVEPLDNYSSSGGVGPGRTFGKLLLKSNPGRLVGLIPCAVGGSSLADWQPGITHYSGVAPYDSMLKRARAAGPFGKLAAILWHQGESDCRLKTKMYQEKLIELIKRIRKDLNLKNVPFICGTLGEFLKKTIFTEIFLTKLTGLYPPYSQQNHRLGLSPVPVCLIKEMDCISTQPPQESWVLVILQNI